MNIQKMYAVGQLIYIDMDKYERTKNRMALCDKYGNQLADSPRKEQRIKAIGGVLKCHICATKEQSLLAYTYKH